MYLDINTIKEKYDGNWIFLVNCKKSEDGALQGGELICASSHRLDVVNSMKHFKANVNNIALKYIGEMSKGGKSIVW